MDTLYIRMPRTGSTSLLALCESNGFASLSGYEMGFWDDKNTHESLYRCIESRLGEEVMNDTFVFSSARNPFVRAISIWNHPSWESARSFDEFCRKIEADDYPSGCAKWHSVPVSDHLFCGQKCLVDLIVRTEHVQEGVDAVCDTVGVPRQKLTHENRSITRKHYTEYYSEVAKEIISKKYAQDIENLGYEFGD